MVLAYLKSQGVQLTNFLSEAKRINFFVAVHSCGCTKIRPKEMRMRDLWHTFRGFKISHNIFTVLSPLSLYQFVAVQIWGKFVNSLYKLRPYGMCCICCRWVTVTYTNYTSGAAGLRPGHLGMERNPRPRGKSREIFTDSHLTPWNS